jgi:hypothetical protein
MRELIERELDEVSGGNNGATVLNNPRQGGLMRTVHRGMGW